MKLSEIRAWRNKACYVTWIDSGSWNSEEGVEPKDMPLSLTSTSGVLVFANRERIVLEHEKEQVGFDRHTHSVIATKMVTAIGNKKRA